MPLSAPGVTVFPEIKHRHYILNASLVLLAIRIQVESRSGFFLARAEREGEVNQRNQLLLNPSNSLAGVEYP